MAEIIFRKPGVEGNYGLYDPRDYGGHIPRIGERLKWVPTYYYIGRFKRKRLTFIFDHRVVDIIYNDEEITIEIEPIEEK